MDRPTAPIATHLRAPLAGAGLALAATLLFLGVQALWLAVTTEGSTPSFEKTREVRTMFRWLVALAILDGVASGFIVSRWKPVGPIVRSMAVALAVAGVLLFLLVLPSEQLSNAGGATPNLGHTLTSDVALGPLALFLVWVAPVYDAAGRWGRPRADRPRMPWDVVICAYPAGHILGHIAVDAFERMREASVGGSLDVILSILAGGAFTGALLGLDFLLRRAKPAEPTPSS